jgi:hypothetical protein
MQLMSHWNKNWIPGNMVQDDKKATGDFIFLTETLPLDLGNNWDEPSALSSVGERRTLP